MLDGTEPIRCLARPDFRILWLRTECRASLSICRNGIGLSYEARRNSPCPFSEPLDLV